jgi:DNA-binding response OmpR family regulator
MWILIAEDEPCMGDLLRKGLESNNHSVTLARDGLEAYAALCSFEFDGAVLDIMMPGLDGVQLTRRLRTEKKSVPVLLLTARDSSADVVRGLDAGADDYLVKPFTFAVLLARLRAISRRREGHSSDLVTLSDLTLDMTSRRVTRSGQEIDLTATEFRILEYMLRRAGKALSRNSILEAVWGIDQTVESNTLDVYMRSLRTKVDFKPECKLLHTLRGFGYILRE